MNDYKLPVKKRVMNDPLFLRCKISFKSCLLHMYIQNISWLIFIVSVNHQSESMDRINY